MDNENLVANIKVYLKIPSLNKTLRQHWSKRSKTKKNWTKAIWAACGGYPPKAKGKVRVTVISYRRRFLDSDNLIGGFKSGRDAMRDLGMVMDDNVTWSEWIYEQKKPEDVENTCIKIERICDGTTLS